MPADDTCLTCGQTDDHPKLHYAEETYHHDCLPPRVSLDVLSMVPKVKEIITAAEDGTRGDDLRAFIEATFPNG